MIKMLLKKKIIIIAVVIVILIVISLVVFKGKKELPYDFSIVERSDIVEEVSAIGTVKSAEDVDLRFEISGTVEKVYVSEGDEVKQGNRLIKLYTGKLYSQFLQAQASHNQAKAELNQFIAGASSEEIQVAEQVVENARVVLEDTKAKSENDLIEDYDDALDTFDNAYFNADKAMKKLETLFDENKLYKEYRSDLTFRDIQSKEDTKNKKLEADFAFENLKELVAAMRRNPSYDEIDNAFNPFLSYLRTIREALDAAGSLIDLVVLHSDYSRTQWDTDRDNIETGRIAINTAVSDTLSAQQVVASQKITNQTNINSAENTLAKAEDDLAETKVGPRKVDIAVYSAKVDKARASVVELQQKLNDAVLEAPIDGIVSKVNVKIGETVTVGGDAVVSLIGASKFQIDVAIPEADIGKVKLGNPVKISLDAFPEEAWPGQVAEMEPAETLIEGVVYYGVTVIFDKIDERVKSGMSADVTIETDRRENVISVPYRAIVYKEGKKRVRILEGKEMREVEVETGLKGSKGEIEIVSGINERDKVVTFIKSR